MDTQAIAQLVKGHPFFNGLTDQDISDIASIAEYKTYQEHDIIIAEGDEANKDLYAIVEGTVVAAIETQNEDKANINVIREGQIFGELSLISDQRRSASIKATSNVSILCISKDRFETAIQTNHHLGMIIYRNISQVLADRIRKTNKMLKHTIIWGW